MEVICAILMIVLGIYVSSVGAGEKTHHTGLLAAGTILTTIGGVLISWIASQVYAREQAREEFNVQLGSLSRNLGQAASQIGHAVNLSLANEVEASAGFAMVDQANQMVYGQVNEIAVMQGAGFDPAYLIETAKSLQDLATQLASKDHQPDEKLAKVQRQLAQVTSDLRAPTVRRTYNLVTVTCPFCGHEKSLQLGSLPGDTAGARCENCQHNYFTHRARTGAAFTRKPGPSRPAVVSAPDAPPVPRWKFNCPECNSGLSTSADSPSKVMVCLTCKAALRVSPAEDLVRSDGQFTLTVQPVSARSGARPQLACPVCRELRNAMISNGTSYFAVCIDDRQLMEITIEDWTAWRAEHKAGSSDEAAPAAPGEGS